MVLFVVFVVTIRTSSRRPLAFFPASFLPWPLVHCLSIIRTQTTNAICSTPSFLVDSLPTHQSMYWPYPVPKQYDLVFRCKPNNHSRRRHSIPHTLPAIRFTQTSHSSTRIPALRPGLLFLLRHQVSTRLSLSCVCLPPYAVTQYARVCIYVCRVNSKEGRREEKNQFCAYERSFLFTWSAERVERATLQQYGV